MVTNAQSGMQGSLWVCTTESGTYTKVAELSDMTLKIDGKEIDVTSVDSDGWGDSLAGMKKWSIAPKGNFISTDTNGYGILMAALVSLSNPVVYCKILSSGTPTVTPVGWSGAARVIGGNIVLISTSAQQSIDWSLSGNGALEVIT